ncbi:dihydrolipoyl dehydrogenase family protein [Lewinella sp. IMCC34183]|uniref:dihydrolipoyl dehydrogenase family protein n=1 Tax=Lewinella sp. IMCC34183 TaxID=2248762 RepID=UPI000E2459B5|nr:NAD(P)/FAD-dependent oxidoreductase [Lewinella sp. IMCC34183]
MPDINYDVIVVGAGSAGQSVAVSAAKAGKTVAITEGREYGGTCPLRGCDPKLVLHAAAEAMHRVSCLAGKGFTSTPPFSWSDLIAWKRTFTEPVPGGSRKKMKSNGIDVYSDYASFKDTHTLLIGDREVRGETIILATGMRPAPLDIPGHELMLTSDEFLEMEDLPEEMIVVGGGYIGTEAAHICHALGCRITLVVTENVPLDKFDHDLSALLRQSDEARGMKYQLNSKATAVRRKGDRFEVDLEDTGGNTTTLLTDRVIHAAGRIPNTEKLTLDRAGIKTDKKGRICVDERLRTNLDHVYALGDCADTGLPLTPVGTHAAGVLAQNLFHGNDLALDYYPIPTVAFCLPGMASVGMTAQEAEDSDREITVHYQAASSWFHPHHLNEGVFGFKLLVDEADQVLVGAHLLGPDATELINLLYVAIRRRISVRDLKDLIFAYPTAASNISAMLSA